MANKWILLIGVVFFSLVFACNSSSAKGVVRIVSDAPMSQENRYNNFSVIFLRNKTEDQGETLLVCKKGVVTNGLGKVLFEPSKELSFWAYNVIVKVNEQTGLPLEIILEPYFDDGKRVGDSIVFEWDSTNKAFIRAFANIP